MLLGSSVSATMIPFILSLAHSLIKYLLCINQRPSTGETGLSAMQYFSRGDASRGAEKDCSNQDSVDSRALPPGAWRKGIHHRLGMEVRRGSERVGGRGTVQGEF